jgi:hypothetical protein
MQFRTWLESEASLNAGMPEAFPVNRGSNTPASDEVKRTGLQPQVDSQEIHTKEKDEQDKLQAIDGAIKRCDSEIPNGDLENHPKVNKFRKIWNKLKEKWDELRSQVEEAPESGTTLATTVGNTDYVKMMQQHPNATVTGDSNYPHGPGIFGQS